MGIGGKMIQRITGHSASDIAHSSGFHGIRGGSQKTQSFSDRQQIEQNRKHVQGYHNSQIATRGKNSYSRMNSFGRSEGNLSDIRGGYGRTDAAEPQKQGYGRTESRDYVHERFGRTETDANSKHGYGRVADKDFTHGYGRVSDAEMAQAHKEAHVGTIGATSIDGTTALMRMNATQNAPQKPTYRQNIKPDFTH